MSIDEQATIQSILEALKTQTTANVAKAIPNISEKPFRIALKSAGYEFSNKAPRGWHYVGQGQEPLDKSIFDYVKRSSPRKKQTSQAVHKDATPSNKEFTKSNTKATSSNTGFTPNSHEIHEQFTQDEIQAIREMLKSWQQVAPQGVPYAHEVGVTPLHDRIKQLPQDDKTRKTIVIDSNIGNQLDEFCKAERVNKSDILHLALMDFLEKYK